MNQSQLTRKNLTSIKIIQEWTKATSNNEIINDDFGQVLSETLLSLKI